MLGNQKPYWDYSIENKIRYIQKSEDCVVRLAFIEQNSGGKYKYTINRSLDLEEKLNVQGVFPKLEESKTYVEKFLCLMYNSASVFDNDECWDLDSINIGDLE